MRRMAIHYSAGSSKQADEGFFKTIDRKMTFDNEVDIVSPVCSCFSLYNLGRSVRGISPFACRVIEIVFGRWDKNGSSVIFKLT